MQQFDVIAEAVVGHDFIERLCFILFFAFEVVAFYHDGICIGKSFYFFFPLIFQRGGAYNESG